MIFSCEESCRIKHRLSCKDDLKLNHCRDCIIQEHGCIGFEKNKIKDDGDGKMVDDQEVIKMTNEYAREIAYAKAIREAKKLGIPYPSRLDLEDLLKEIEHQKSLRKG